MEYRRLGASGLKVSEISLGSWLTYGGYVGKEAARQTILKAYESGVNFFDTANVYMRGEAERAVGEALSQLPRSTYVLATKVRGPMGDLPNQQGLSRKHIMEACDASLKRLGTEYIDLYYCHYPDADTPKEETYRAMDDLVRQGKVLYVGFSNMSASDIAQAVGIVERQGLHPVVANQPLYNMFAPGIEDEIIPLCDRHGIGQVVYSPLAQGVLAGRFESVTDLSGSARAADASGGEAVRSWLKEEYVVRARLLQEMASDFGLSLSQLALAWTLRHPQVASAIVGASRPEQIEENVRASGVRLAGAQWAEFESAVGRTPASV
ncbi:aldo/keto reductase family protein [Cohnella hashimotonis]|uniref:Aldo/keto reductase family protein n=1 Tax=Cohnella hashimotonis TaxID=2826895 RepID=A0ABT6TAJ5_9BACL|nr:aldo/keto reductase family protein [Cohnella hashimotonis]MDI4643845.1 aldo/keto reductase family protein [Cohnella hashimotonis]